MAVVQHMLTHWSYEMSNAMERRTDLFVEAGTNPFGVAVAVFVQDAAAEKFSTVSYPFGCPLTFNS